MNNYTLTIQISKESDIQALSVAAEIAKGCGEIVYIKHGARDLGFVLKDGTLSAPPISPTRRLNIIVAENFEEADVLASKAKWSSEDWVYLRKISDLRDVPRDFSRQELYIHHLKERTVGLVDALGVLRKAGVQVWETYVDRSALFQRKEA